ncbi:glucose-inactivated glycerol proton symporter STL1 [Sugiyamaella lignohabitans]|uniref:Glucose-inactivated glycerol proton symporter STL1 n=1 Tax=Sugiyamaella lignohabitans TaxID=796027 RepID=A0A167CF66_9ASCO|nr:glucose-inactivated glycerol proton symporter STL1 [Sugiyamaella lignohabitans]ANB11610.1 glucose-inactivated glycerol proton symporter STL1 [Sugiyamaella lignohabitans]
MTAGRNKGTGLTGKPLLYFTTVFVSLGVFLFGYEQGVMSSVIVSVYFKDFFDQPTRAEIGTMIAILEIGALISSLIVGRVGDIIGRRKTIFYGALIFVIGGCFQAFCPSMSILVIGRFISGIGVGMLSTIVPVYQSEISPSHNRGKLACIEFTGNIVGYCSSVWVDYACSYIHSDMAWRLPLFLQCVMGTLLLLGSLIIAETPRWLLDNDYDDEGMVAIADLHGGGDIYNPQARQEFREIKEAVLLHRMEGERSYSDMWRKYKKRVLIAMSSQAFAQLNGINVISYYAPLVFEQAGWVGRDAILMTGINGIVYIMSTIPPWYLSDRWGRRVILISGAIAMAISLSTISYFMYVQVSYTPTMVVIFVVIYNAFFGYSWGPIPWLYPPEIMPLSVRAKGASLSTASNWAFNWLVGQMTPILQEKIQWRLYLMHAFFCICSFVTVYFVYPETMGVQLEDMDSLFGDKSIRSSSASSIDTQSLLSHGNDDVEPNYSGPSTLQPSAAAIARGRSMSGGTAPFITNSTAFSAVLTSSASGSGAIRDEEDDIEAPKPVKESPPTGGVTGFLYRAFGGKDKSKVPNTDDYKPLNRNNESPFEED